jgi:hypothetical protein
MWFCLAANDERGGAAVAGGQGLFISFFSFQRERERRMSDERLVTTEMNERPAKTQWIKPKKKRVTKI